MINTSWIIERSLYPKTWAVRAALIPKPLSLVSKERSALCPRSSWKGGTLGSPPEAVSMPCPSPRSMENQVQTGNGSRQENARGMLFSRKSACIMSLSAVEDSVCNT